MKKKLALLLACQMVLSAFAGGGSMIASAEADDEYKVIRYGHAYESTTLDPQNATDDGSYDVIGNVSEGLLIGYGGQVYPGIAESWEISEDGLVYTFHLRESTWSDGTPLTAQDFVYAAQRILDPSSVYENASSFHIFKNGEAYNLGECSFDEVGVKALDDYTLEYTLEYPDATLLYSFGTYGYAPMNQAACEKYGVSYGAESGNLLTNGPFYVDEWLHDSRIVLKKNENYWNADSVKVDEVQFIIGAAGQVAVDMFMAGDLDVCSFGDNASINTLISLGMEYETLPSSYYFSHLNCSGSSEEAAPFMSNANFRKALSCAISREAIVTVADVVAEPAYRITSPALLAADGSSWIEKYPLEGWSTAAEPEKAKEYLALALEEIGATVEDVPELVMLCFDSEANMVKLQAIQDMIYQTLGVNCVISPQPIQQMIEMAYSGQFDFWVGGKPFESTDWLSQVGGEYDATNASAIAGYDNPEYSALYEQAEQAPTMEEREELVYQLEQIIVDDMTTLCLYWLEDYMVHVPGLTGVNDANGFGPYFALCDLVSE